MWYDPVFKVVTLKGEEVSLAESRVSSRERLLRDADLVLLFVRTPCDSAIYGNPSKQGVS